MRCWPPGAPEPNLLLREEGARAAGLAGCNRFAGSFRREGQALSLGPLAVTRMACADGVALEQEYLAALQATRRWNILAGTLELYDQQGAVLARFGTGRRP